MSEEEKKPKLGVCGTDKKLNSKPMKEILKRLENVQVYLIGNDYIYNLTIDKWPIVDYFICIGQKKDFPLDKAIDYCKLYTPFVFNDLEHERHLLSRKTIHKILVENSIKVPLTLLKDQDTQIEEDFDSITINGTTLKKPFIEKPLDAADHNIYIYYSPRGCRKLFRKIENKSSDFDPDISKVRKNSFIYQEFLESKGNQVYVVGKFVYAESRKAPSVDGIVERCEDGKEKRYIVDLTDDEKELAIKVANSFKHFICGLDFLRTENGTFVIDVNGMSFVKGSKTYYDQCSKNIMDIILKNKN